MGRIPKYRRVARAELFAQATGTTPVTVTIPRGEPHSLVPCINHILATTVNGTANVSATIAVNATTILRQNLPNTDSYFFKLDLDGAWPQWRGSANDSGPYGNPREIFNGPPPSGGTTYPIYGGSAASGELNQRAGMSITPSFDMNLDGIAFWLRKVGNPSDTFRITIRDTSITGGVLSTIEVPSTVFSERGGLYIFNLPSPIALTASTQYYVQLLRLGVRNTTSYVEAQASTTSLYSGGGAYTFDNNVWSSESTTDDLTWGLYVPVDITFTPPAASTGTCLTVMYHYEKASEIRN